MPLKNVADLVTEMGENTYKFWVFIGNRLLQGEKQYGGFNFEKYNLKMMGFEELGDLAVYRLAEEYIKVLEAEKGLEIDE